MSDEKKKLGTRAPLGIKRTVEAGKVKQSFSHGRSNTVVVEVKKRRILKPGDAAPEPKEEAKKPEAAPAPEKKAPEPKKAAPRKKTEAEEIAEQMRVEFSLYHHKDMAAEHRSTASFGIAPYNQRLSLAESLDRADRALYRAKRQGRNCVAIFGTDQREKDDGALVYG